MMQLENIKSSIYEIAQLTGLPLWALIIISTAFAGILYFYGIRVPMAILAIRKEIICQNKLFESVISMAKERTKNQSSRYKYKS